MGHATRCVPIILSLLEKNTVIIGVTPLNRFFFENQFPACPKVEVPSYDIRYSSTLPVWFKILLQWPKIKDVIKKENKCLKEIVRHYHVDLIISDNRFGLSHKKIKTIFITHQLNIPAPFFSFLINYINRRLIHRFNEVWIPDYEEKDKRLSGNLSDAEKMKIPVTFIGPKSYLSNRSDSAPGGKLDYLILLSGIEPQRSRLEKLLMCQFDNSGKKIVLVRGSKSAKAIINPYLEINQFSEGEELRRLIVSADTVICRSGFSTLMDLHLLDKRKIILIPTPGQTEQVYLAEHWKEKFGAKVIPQHSLISKTHSLLER